MFISLGHLPEVLKVTLQVEVNSFYNKMLFFYVGWTKSNVQDTGKSNLQVLLINVSDN
jgi:hypothetical protein